MLKTILKYSEKVYRYLKEYTFILGYLFLTLLFINAISNQPFGFWSGTDYANHYTIMDNPVEFAIAIKLLWIIVTVGLLADMGYQIYKFIKSFKKGKKPLESTAKSNLPLEPTKDTLYPRKDSNKLLEIVKFILKGL